MNKTLRDFISSLEGNYKIKVTCLTATSIYVATLIITFFVGHEGATKYNFLVCIIGFVLGWFVGIIISPYDGDEEKKFTNYSKLIGTFISGYIVSKIDKFWDNIISNNAFSDSLFISRIIFFLIFFCVTLIVVFAFRRYIIIKT